MREGLRVRHTKLKGPMVVAVRDRTEKIPNKNNSPWPGCSICQLPSPGHDGYKTRHVTIDAEGEGIVSVGVWEGLKNLYDRGGFELVNTVTNPPNQKIDFEHTLKGAEGKLTVVQKVQNPITATFLNKLLKRG